MPYMNHGYNDTPVIHGEANTTVAEPAMKAFVLNESGKVALPAASGDFALGIALANADAVGAGDRLDLQIKDGCYALAGEDIDRGDLLMAHTDGSLKKAVPGTHVLAVALADAASGKPVEVFIIRTYLPAFAVDFATPPTDGQVLKYDGTNKVWKPAVDATN